MADDNTKGPTSQTSGNANPALSMTMTTSEPTLTTVAGSGTVDAHEESFSADIRSTAQEAAGDELPPELQDLPEAGAGDADSDSTTDDASPEDGAEAGASEPLPDFDPASEEVLAAYDERYLTDGPDGHKVINLDAFNSSIQANFKDGKTDISAHERAYVKATLGVSDELIDQHIEGLVAKAQKQDAEVYAHVGGTENFEALHTFAAKQYTQAQKDAYNAAAKKAQKGDFTDLKEQLDLLSLRASKAGVEVAGDRAKQLGAGRLRRPSSPVKTAGQNTQGSSRPQAAAGDVSIFKSSEEHRVAFNEATASKDPAKIAAVRQKLIRSQASKGWQG